MLRRRIFTWGIIALTCATALPVFADGNQTFSTPGSYSFTVPLDAGSITVELWGGGGGGQQCYAISNGTSYPTISCSGGGSGGTSSFSSGLMAYGGQGAGAYIKTSNLVPIAVMANGGTAQGGDINTPGQAGNWNNTLCPGKGGSSPNGGSASGGSPGGGGDGICNGTWGASGGGGGGYTKKTFAAGTLTPGSQVNLSVGGGGALGGAPGAVHITWTSTTTAATTTTATSGPVPVLSAVQTQNITSTSAEIHWNTDIPSDSRVAIQVLGSLTYTAATTTCNGAGGYATSHCISLTGLSAGTTYQIIADSRSQTGGDGYTPGMTFVTPATATAGTATTTSTASTFPAITSLTVGNVTQNSMSVYWMTDIAADSRIAYGSSTVSISNISTTPCSSSGGAYVTAHCITVNGLSAGTTYYLKAMSTSQGGTAGLPTFTQATTLGAMTSPFGTTTLAFPTIPTTIPTILDTGTTTATSIASTTVLAALYPVFQGRVTLGGTGTNATMWAWADTGDRLNPVVGDDGSFSVLLTRGTIWHLGANKEGTDGTGYKSTDITIDTSVLPIPSQDIALEQIDKPVAKEVQVQQDASTQVTVRTTDGASVSVPPNAIDSGSAAVTVAVNPTVEAPNQQAATVVGTAYDITAKDHLGNQVKALASSVQITLPYDPQELASLHITPQSLKPSYFDESTQTWITLTNFTLDTTNHVVIATVNHFTRFALVAAADVTPPSAPTAIVASLSKGTIKIDWTNPSADFDHAKVYRSTELGKLGSVKAPEVTTGHFADADISADTTYYYTIRSIDPAGNESANTDQVRVSTSGASGLSTNLKFGARGDQVLLLQQILIAQKLLAEDMATGYFGKMTLGAVIVFQEKYTDEVLAPAGLTKGSGFVGAFTRTKLNALAQGK